MRYLLILISVLFVAGCKDQPTEAVKWDQHAGEGKIKGLVTYMGVTSRPLSEVVITIDTLIIKSNYAGEYETPYLKPGIYNISAQLAGYCDTLFSVAVTADSVLSFNIPLRYTLPEIVSYYTASYNASTNKTGLNWRTETELNNKGYEIQLYKDTNFISIGFISGRGTMQESTNYSYVINNTYNNSYYRLKQVAFDGTIRYSYTLNAGR